MTSDMSQTEFLVLFMISPPSVFLVSVSDNPLSLLLQQQTVSHCWLITLSAVHQQIPLALPPTYFQKLIVSHHHYQLPL
jgi:hypothetical protein